MKISTSSIEIPTILLLFGICFNIQVTTVSGQSKLSNGNGASSQNPQKAISISSESDSDSKIENTSLCQVFVYSIFVRVFFLAKYPEKC